MSLDAEKGSDRGPVAAPETPNRVPSLSSSESSIPADKELRVDNDEFEIPEKFRHEVLPDFAQGKVVVGWDGPNDPENPKNWPMWKKIMTTVIISLCTTSLYMGSAIVTPAAEQLQEHFETTRTKTALGITLFVWGYGIGSLWFSPMSEIPLFRGRNPTYFFCQLIFCILQIPTGLSNHIGSYATLRFLAGLFASPPLSTAGATLGDVWDMPGRVVALVIWAYGAIAGPFIGPLIGAALVQGHGFRYIFWFMLAISGGFLILMVVFFPETSEQELLMRKARALRKETGELKYIAPGEILMHLQTPGGVLKDMFYKPIKLTIMEPVVMLMDLHLGLVYSVLYLFMEAMPIVYVGLYGFNLVQMGLAFLSFLVGAAIASVLYVFFVFTQKKNMSSPEKVFGKSAIFGAAIMPAGLLIWGWLERKDIHWVIGMIGNLFFAMGAFTMFQSYFGFLATMFPPNAVGSAFASNNIVRSLMGGAFPLFGTVMYSHTSTPRYPVGWGCTIIALAAVLMIPLPIYIYLRGASLREYAQRKYGEKLLR